MKTSEKTDNVFASLVKLRSSIVQPKKDATNPFLKNGYVTLEGVVKVFDDAVKDAKDVNLTFVQEATSNVETGSVSVITTILDGSGQFITFDPLELPVAKKDAQGYGSSITYAKRYSLSSVLGITSDMDDDGEASVGRGNENTNKHSDNSQLRNARDQRNSSSLNKTQVIKLENMIKEYAKVSSIDYHKALQTILTKWDIEKLADIKQPQFDSRIGTVQVWIHKKEKAIEENNKKQEETKKPLDEKDLPF